MLRLIEKHWGKGRSVEVYAPSLAGNDEYVRWTGRHERAAAGPGAALALVQMNHEIDVRQVLATISIPASCCIAPVIFPCPSDMAVASPNTSLERSI